jgi:hypothetical protein
MENTFLNKWMFTRPFLQDVGKTNRIRLGPNGLWNNMLREHPESSWLEAASLRVDNKTAILLRLKWLCPRVGPETRPEVSCTRVVHGPRQTAWKRVTVDTHEAS